MWTKFKTGVALSALAAGLVGSALPVVAEAPEKEKAAAPAQARRASKLDLTTDKFSELFALIRPHENEWRHIRVNWLTDVVAARKKAAAEDKPIVICYTGGAGYNEPLGIC
jgi:hypothetical protein